MAYRLKLDEGIQAGVRRIGVAQIERAIACLEATGDESATGIHEARKSLKRIRALLRLVRPALGERVFARENGDFRDTGALLSHTRDTQILLETVTKLDTRFGEASGSGLRKLREVLAGSLTVADAAAEAGPRAEAIKRLQQAKPRFARLKLDPDDFDAIRAGLEQTFRRARAAFDASYDEPSDERFHDLRKGVQQHWRHMALLRRAWPEVADARLATARRLSQILGDDHDLAILAARLESPPLAEIPHRDRRTILKLAARRQDELRAQARPMGERLFADGPRSVGRRFATYWNAARELNAAGRGQPGDGLKVLQRNRSPGAD